MTHYRFLIQDFGAPNGLCSSITESKHIKAVKKPWRRSSKHGALAQILVINERLDKLAASRVDFEVRGMLFSSLFGVKKPVADDGEGDDEEQGAVDGHNILVEVKLARKPGLCYYSLQSYILSHIHVPSTQISMLPCLFGTVSPPSHVTKFGLPFSICPNPWPH